MNLPARFTLAALIVGGMSFLMAAGPTVLDGVYTDAQAKRGQGIYEANCTSCHMDNLVGNPEAPALTGPVFMEVWRDDSLDGLYGTMKSRMPRLPGGEPGSLKDQQYADIVAWVLKFNEYPAGQKELTPDQMENIQFIGKDGPKPLPNNSLVWTAGCMTQVDAENWSLTKSLDPARTHDAENTPPEEVKRADAKGLGTGTFRLRLATFQDNVPSFKPESVKGKKVLVKGALTRQTGNDRITVVSLSTISEACGN